MRGNLVAHPRGAPAAPCKPTAAARHGPATASLRRLAGAAWLAALAALGTVPAVAGDSLFVWEEALRMTDGAVNDGLDDTAAQGRLLDFCTAPEVGITRLYFLADPTAWDFVSLGTFLHAATARGIEVYAVPPGTLQDDWARPFPWRRKCDHGVVLDWVRRIAAFNRWLRVGGFRGIQLDIELHSARAPRFPWGRKAVWRSGNGGFLRDRRNEKLARQYLALLDRVRRQLDEDGSALRVAATLPTWLDRDGRSESYRLSYRGASKVLAHHVMDRVDFVTLMNYLDGSSARSREKLWSAIADEARYGPVESMFETAPPGRRGAAPRAEQTLFDEGEQRYRELRDWLQGRFADNPNFIGCGAHHYLSSYGSGEPGWPAH